MPQWKREGYADYVAQEPRNDAGQEEGFRTRSPDAPVLKYYEARRRVARAMNEEGRTAESLLRTD